MRTLPVKSTSRSGSDQGYSPETRREMIAVAAYYHAERRGFRGGEELSDWIKAEAEIERLLEPEPANDPKTSARHRFQEKLETQLREWDARLDELKAKARDATTEIRAEFDVQLEALAGKRAVAQEKLQELRQHGEWAWEDLKDSAEKAWSELREAIKRTASLFK